ncbi:hypothetical protein CVT25_013475 [Psilocybe cyanescens]|uniref:Uncharacterized protein n=1 Tax=Psilocybe cyanescens TaxID=93625 RepID=A0A409WTH9_PSICY|nr:hypothetical protein CVT25_013475 [Psilocybe cyanescens]
MDKTTEATAHSQHSTAQDPETNKQSQFSAWTTLTNSHRPKLLPFNQLSLHRPPEIYKPIVLGIAYSQRSNLRLLIPGFSPPHLMIFDIMDTLSSISIPHPIAPKLFIEQLRLSGSSTAADKNNTDAASDSKDGHTMAPPPPKVLHHFNDAELLRYFLCCARRLDTAGAAHVRQLNGFFSVLALCYTVLTSVDPETGKIEYKAQSPGEAALVQAAADVGVEGDDSHSGGAKGPKDVDAAAVGPPAVGGFEGGKSLAAAAAAKEGLVERYELLNILVFTSARKRMSAVLRKLDADDGGLFLLSKGADNVIFERLKQGSREELKATTEKQLDHFARDLESRAMQANELCESRRIRQLSKRRLTEEGQRLRYRNNFGVLFLWLNYRDCRTGMRTPQSSKESVRAYLLDCIGRSLGSHRRAS